MQSASLLIFRSKHESGFRSNALQAETNPTSSFIEERKSEKSGVLDYIRCRFAFNPDVSGNPDFSLRILRIMYFIIAPANIT